MAETLLKVQNVETFYGNIRALGGVSVEVNKDAINANMEAMLEMGDLKSPVETSGMVWSEARLTTAP